MATRYILWWSRGCFSRKKYPLDHHKIYRVTIPELYHKQKDFEWYVHVFLHIFFFVGMNLHLVQKSYWTLNAPTTGKNLGGELVGKHQRVYGVSWSPTVSICHKVIKDWLLRCVIIREVTFITWRRIRRRDIVVIWKTSLLIIRKTWGC